MISVRYENGSVVTYRSELSFEANIVYFSAFSAIVFGNMNGEMMNAGEANNLEWIFHHTGGITNTFELLIGFQ